MSTLPFFPRGAAAEAARTVTALLACALAAAPAGATTYTVTSNADSGPTTLRAAIAASNASAGADIIKFSLAAGQRTISITTPLSATGAVDIDGTSQPGYAGVPLVRIDGIGLPPNNSALSLVANSKLRGLMVTRAPGAGVVLRGTNSQVDSMYLGTDGVSALGNRTGIDLIDAALNMIGAAQAGRHNVISGNTLEGISIRSDATFNLVVNNRIGTNAAGTAAIGNGYAGMRVFGSNNVIGDPAPLGGNLVSGNGDHGVQIADGSDNAVRANRIGTTFDGLAALPNGATGIDDSAADTVIGGAGANDGNLVSGNGVNGIVLGGTGSVVRGNRLGTNVAGTAAIANDYANIRVFGADHVIGTPDAGNLISGSGRFGIDMGADALHIVIQGNRIGTNAAGTAALPNVSGLAGDGVDVLIGGAGAGQGNLISGNSYEGLTFRGSDAQILGNRIGTNAAGTAALPNEYGVRVWGDGVQIGSAVAGNLISGNSGLGISIEGANVQVLGNRIGVNAAGTAALGNQGIAIRSFGDGAGTVIGAPGAGNVISGNGRGIEHEGLPATIQSNIIGLDATQSTFLPNGDASGITLYGDGSQVGGTAAGAGNVIVGDYGISLRDANANRIEGNVIGTNAAQSQVFGAGYAGVFLYRANGNSIGGSADGAGNVIRGADAFGVYDTLGRANAIQRNSVSGSGLAGIELDPFGPSANDIGDIDHGPNEGQNRPIVLQATALGGNVAIGGGLHSRPGESYRIELFHSGTCHASGLGEAQHFLGALTTTLDASGNASFAHTVANPHGAGVITATATDADGNTSELSPCITIGAASAGQFGLWREPYLAYEDIPTVRIHVLRSGGLTGPASVRLRTQDGDATAPADYAAFDGVLQFAHGEWIRTVDIPLVLDDANEGNEEFAVELLTPTGATIADPGAKVVLFDHDDGYPFLSIGDSNVVEPASGQGMATFVIALSQSDHDVSVGYETFDGSAVAGADYVATSGLVTFAAAGPRTLSVQVPVLADSLGEGDETFHLRLIWQGEPMVAYISEGQATIVDEDGIDHLFGDGFE